MALSYRAPVEEVIARFTSEEQSTVSSTAIKAVRDKESDLHSLFNFSMTSLAKERLTKSGIYLSPYSFVPHSHPVCKTLENYMLYIVLPRYVNKSFFFVGIKDFKLSFLKIRNQALNNVVAINRYVTSLDNTRYSNDFVCANSKHDASIIRHMGLERSEALRDLLPEVIRQKSRNLFLHDELHYWSCNDLIYFLEECRPENVIATLVIPPEVLVGCSESLNPWAYRYRLEGSKLIFAPDGCWSESYTQPIHSRYLLKAKRIYLNDGSYYNVDLVSTKFCHHLVAITKGNLVNQEHRHFSGFDAIGLKHLSKYSSSMQNCYPVRIDIVTKVYLYLRTLKKPDLQSAEAKLRQLIDEPNGREIKFIEDFAKLVIDCGQVATVLNVSKFKRFIFNMMPHIIGSFTEFFNSRSIEGFIYDLEAFNFSIRTKDYDRSFLDQLMFESIHPEITDFDLPKILDQGYMGKSIKDLDRAEFRYVGEVSNSAGSLRKKFNIRTGMSFKPLVVIGCYHLSLNNNLTVEELAHLVSQSIKAKIPDAEVKTWLNCGFRRAVSNALWEQKKGRMATFANVFKGHVRWFLNRERVNSKFICGSDSFQNELCEEAIENYKQVIADLLFFSTVAFTKAPDFTNESMAGSKDSAQHVGKLPHSKIDGELVSTGETSREHDHNSSIVLSKMRSKSLQNSCINKTLADEVVAHDGVKDYSAEQVKTHHTLIQRQNPTDLNFEDDKGGLKKQLENFERLGLVKLTGDNWDRVMNGLCHLIGENHNFAKSDLCSCFQNNNFLRNSSMLEDLNVGLRGVQAASFDSLMIVRKEGIHKANGVITENLGFCALICLKGVVEYHEKDPFDQEISTLKINAGVMAKACYGLFDMGNMSYAAVLVQTDRVRKGSWIAHNDSCYFSGSTQLLLGCPIRLIRTNDHNDFNVFDVPGDGNCLWHSLGHLLGLDGLTVKEGLLSRMHALGYDPHNSEFNGQFEENAWAEREAVALFCKIMQRQLIVITPDYDVSWVFGEIEWDFLGFLILFDSHYQPAVPSNGCVIRAIAEAIGRKEVDVVNFLCKAQNRFIFEDLCRGKGLNIANLEDTFKIFDIRAICDMSGHIEEFNPDGTTLANFTIGEGHMSYTSSKPLKRAEPKVDSLRTVSKSALAILIQNGTSLAYKPKLERAEILQDCLITGKTGMISSENFNGCERIDLSGQLQLNLSRNIIIIMGTFGSGKSWLYKEFIRKSPGKNVMFVSPRRALADSIKDDIGVYEKKSMAKLSGVGVVTFEVFLKKIHDLKRGHTVILDEIQLFPPGYVDLLCILANEHVQIVLAGDPCQSHYDSSKDRAVLGHMGIDIVQILKEQSYRYNIESRRFKNMVFSGRLPCEMKFTGNNEEIVDKNYMFFQSLRELVREYPFGLEVCLVSNFEEKKIINSYFGVKQKVLTFGESTGLNFRSGCIMISLESKVTDDRRWLTALSRFSNELIFVNVTGVNTDNLITMFAGKPLQMFLTKQSSDNVIKRLLPGDPSFFRGFDTHIGKDEGLVEAKLVGDPWLKSELFLGQKEDAILDDELPIDKLEDDWFKCHLPLAEMEPVRARWAAKLALKEGREFRVQTEVTEQFPDEHHSYGEQLTNACERYEAIYPRHKGTDSVTFLMAVKKRLKFSRPDVESAKLRRARPFGKFLLDEFLKRIPLRQEHDNQLFASCVADFEEKKVSKPAAVIENHSGRSCRDWLADVALIFMKSQHCTKFDNRFRDAKAGQTLACFHHSILCRFAPFMRYIEKKVHKVLPKNFYIHSGKNIDDLNSWVIENNFDDVCTESDYEAFDASQDHYILAFEIQLMEYLGLPGDLLADYIYIKTHLGSKLGNFSIMRFTGEASTFLFNTLANMLFTFLRYDLNGGESIAFAGDDMCANKRLRVSSKHEGFLKKISLKAKVNFVSNPTFCGWCLTPDGVFKRPQLVWERMCIARERNNLNNCIDNYAIEVSYAYKLGELALGRMTEEEVENQYLCTRFIIRHKHLMKCGVASNFSS